MTFLVVIGAVGPDLSGAENPHNEDELVDAPLYMPEAMMRARGGRGFGSLKPRRWCRDN